MRPVMQQHSSWFYTMLMAIQLIFYPSIGPMVLIGIPKECSIHLMRDCLNMRRVSVFWYSVFPSYPTNILSENLEREKNLSKHIRIVCAECNCA